MITSPNLGLVIWNLPTDPWDSTQFGTNLAKIDEHDHTEGKGLPITTGALADGSVTSAKLAPNAINSQTIPANSIDGSKLTAGAVTTNNIAANAITEPLLDPNVLPIGSVIPWWTPNLSLNPVPSGWYICNGQTVAAGSHTFQPLNTPIVLPDMRNRFILGADVSGTGTGHTTPPAIGASGTSVNGDAHVIDFSHTHDMSHTHGLTVPGHTHQFTPPAHVHNTVESNGLTMFNIIPVQDSVPYSLGSIYYVLKGAANMSTTGLGQNSPIQTSSAGAITANTDPSSAIGVTTSSQSATITGPAQGTNTGVIDIRPDFVGLLFLMKVKHG